MSLQRRAKWAAMLLLALSLGVAAQDEPARPDRYRVEVVVFRHADQSRNTPEQAPPISGPIANLPPPPGLNRPQLEFLLLDPKPARVPLDLAREELELDSVVERLQRVDAYQPMLHFGWQQTAAGRAAAKDYWLSAAVGEQLGLTGKLRVYKERFLHLAMELEFDPRDGSGKLAVIEESRRLRDDRLQYFDHPQFGVIARVTRIEPESPDDKQAPAGANPPATTSAATRR
jgi:hypothetical protein